MLNYAAGHRDGYDDGKNATAKRLAHLWLFAFVAGVLFGMGIASVVL